MTAATLSTANSPPAARCTASAPAWRSCCCPSRPCWSAALPLVALVMFLTAQALLLGDDGFGPDTPIGWPERALVLLYAAWQITVARVISRRG